MTIYITDYIQDPDIEKGVLDHKISKNKETAEVLLVWHQAITKEYLKDFPKIKGVVRYGVGYDMVDLDAIKEISKYFDEEKILKPWFYVTPIATLKN
mgnify:CR=1 FL=1